MAGWRYEHSRGGRLATIDQFFPHQGFQCTFKQPANYSCCLVAVATALLFEVFTVLLAPMIATTVFDEVGAHDSFDFSLNVLVSMQSCLRYYLLFDDNLFQIMKVTCLPNGHA